VEKLALTLGAHRSGWAVSASHGSEVDRNPKVREVYRRVLKRDDYTCQGQGCGWRSERYQEIHPRDEDHRNFNEDNLVTLCPLCHQVFHLPLAASSAGGDLIWLPEIDQGTLNLLSIPLFVALNQRNHKWYNLASSLNATLTNRVAFFRSRIGKPDPAMLAQVLVRMTPEAYANRAPSLRHIRLLPRRERFTTAIEYWERHQFADWKDTDWEKALPAGFDLNTVVPVGAGRG
jgi:intracellular multiplication protein IcmJ